MLRSVVFTPTSTDATPSPLALICTTTLVAKSKVVVVCFCQASSSQSVCHYYDPVKKLHRPSKFPLSHTPTFEHASERVAAEDRRGDSVVPADVGSVFARPTTSQSSWWSYVAGQRWVVRRCAYTCNDSQLGRERDRVFTVVEASSSRTQPCGFDSVAHTAGA
jgi:hypothetical protein